MDKTKKIIFVFLLGISFLMLIILLIFNRKKIDLYFKKLDGIEYKEIYKKHKRENTLIGIDVSTHQKLIDFPKIKANDVEFIMIRLGYQSGFNNEYKLDKYFYRNIKEAKKYKIPIGIYFYSYAQSLDDIEKEVDFIIKNLNGIKLDLPIAFDWENWMHQKKYNISNQDLNNFYKRFKEKLNKAGYKTILYSSKYYLENVWDNDLGTWLAHYRENTTYQGDYFMWQLSDKGVVPGIYYNVDINILYLDKYAKYLLT